MDRNKIDSVFVEYSYGEKRMVTLIPNEDQQEELKDMILEIEDELKEDLI